MLAGTPVQHARAHVISLVNLRGQIVTLFDLDPRLGLGPRRLTPHTHNMMLKREGVGLVVDKIDEVLEIWTERTCRGCRPTWGAGPGVRLPFQVAKLDELASQLAAIVRSFKE